MDLASVYDSIPTERYCTGCHACAIRCSGSVPATEGEWVAIRNYLREEYSVREIARLFREDKRFRISDDYTIEFCPLYDVRRRLCAVYPVRPLVCRLLGFVEWMPCPVRRPLPKLAWGVELMCQYAEMEPRGLPEWLELRPMDLAGIVARSRGGVASWAP